MQKSHSQQVFVRSKLFLQKGFDLFLRMHQGETCESPSTHALQRKKNALTLINASTVIPVVIYLIDQRLENCTFRLMLVGGTGVEPSHILTECAICCVQIVSETNVKRQGLLGCGSKLRTQICFVHRGPCWERTHAG